MKMKVICVLLAALLALPLCAGCGADAREFSPTVRTLVDGQRHGADIGYKKYSDGSVVIVDHSGTGSITIPAELDGMPVVELAPSLFEGREDVISLTVPDGVEIIGSAAFRNCTALTDVTLGDTLWSVGFEAFAGTPWLGSLTDEFSVVGDGVLIKYNGGATGVSLPDGVRHVAGGVFASRALKKIDLGSALTVGEKAFYACDKLIRVDCSDAVVLIGESAFESCVGMEEIELARTLVRVGDNAFAACRELAVAVYYGTDVEFTHVDFGEGNTILSDAALVIYRGGAD